MRHVQLARLAGAQFNRVSRAQLAELGLSASAIQHQLSRGHLVIVEQGVFALPPLLAHDEWGRWMAATLTSQGSLLSHTSAAAAWGVWSSSRRFESITRPGTGGPKRHGGVLVFHSTALDGEGTERHGIPITRIERTLLDLAASVSERALARAIREASRLQLTSTETLVESLGHYRGRRGAARLGAALARYSGLPLGRARSGAEVRALEALRDAGRPMPRVNVRIAGEEADLSWSSVRLVVEIDGAPFHMDRGEDLRKQRLWEGAGWTVRRISADDVYERPQQLLALSPQSNVLRTSSER